MGLRPNQPQAVARHVHEPVDVRTLITDELVGHICSTCLDACLAHPPSDRR